MIGLSLFMFQNASYGMDSEAGEMPTEPTTPYSTINVDTITSRLENLSFHGYQIPKALLGFGDAPEGLPTSLSDFFANEVLSQTENALTVIATDQLVEDFFIVPFEHGKRSVYLSCENPKNFMSQNLVIQNTASSIVGEQLITDDESVDETPTFFPAYYGAYSGFEEKKPISFAEKAKIRKAERLARKAEAHPMEPNENKPLCSISPLSITTEDFLQPSNTNDFPIDAQQKHKEKPRKILTDDEVLYASPVIEKKSPTGLSDIRDDEALWNS